MTYLVDANVLSESTRVEPNPRAVEWLKKHERMLVVDAIVLGELYTGILLLSKGRKRESLESWFLTVIKSIECIPWDRAVSMRWAKLVTDLRRRGRCLPILDSMIAATALTHNLVVATRNVADFHGTGVKTVNPFG